MINNNITRFLDAKKIHYQVFELPPEKLGAFQTAELLSVSAHVIYKSIVVMREKPGKAILAIIPGDHEVDLKALAALLGEKKVRVPTQNEAEKITGLLAGGISPLALINKGFQFFLDASTNEQTEIHISGGQRGINIRLSVKDFVSLINPRIAPISKPLEHSELDD